MSTCRLSGSTLRGANERRDPSTPLRMTREGRRPSTTPTCATMPLAAVRCALGAWRSHMVDLNQFFRKAILTATHNRVVTRVVRDYGMRLGAARFVAGESLDAAVPVLRRLNEQGLVTNTALLGEAVRDRATVARVVVEYGRILERIAAEGLQTNVALKVTRL